MNMGDPLGLGGPPRFGPLGPLGPLVVLESATAPGQHPFADYVSNGFVERAFAHALAMLRA